MVGPRRFSLQSLKEDCNQKCFQDNNSYLQNVIHFLFEKFQLILIGKFRDIVV